MAESRAQTKRYGQVTLSDQLGFVGTLISTIGAGVTALISYPFKDPSTVPTNIGKHVMFSILRTALKVTNIGQQQFISPPTTQTYNAFTKKHNLQCQTTEHAQTGAKSHWFGSPDAKTVLLYCHGGAYILPPTSMHITYLHNLVTAINHSSNAPNAFAILMLEYSLAPTAYYPTPLSQAVECLLSLLDNGRSPADIILGGDSAGGNLCLSILSHYLHPHPSSQVLKLDSRLDTPLKGLLLISPWVQFDTSAQKSFSANASADMFVASTLDVWSKTALGGAAPDNYIEPIRADPQWWKGIGSLADKILVWGGGNELLIDSITAFVEGKLRPNVDEGKLDYVVEYRQVHEEVILMGGLRVVDGGAGEGDVVQKWLRARL